MVQSNKDLIGPKAESLILESCYRSVQFQSRIHIISIWVTNVYPSDLSFCPALEKISVDCPTSPYAIENNRQDAFAKSNKNLKFQK